MTMFDWVVNLLLVEAGVFLISMAGCFVAGICLEARELRREARIERLAREVSEMSNLELLREVSHDGYLSYSTTFYSNNVAYFEMHLESRRPQLDNLKRAIEEMSERIEKSE